MRKQYWLVWIWLVASPLLTAQQKQITLEDIWGGAFTTEGMEVLRSMNDGQHYTILNSDPEARMSSIDKYRYSTQEKVATLVSSDSLSGIPYFTSYTFSGNGGGTYLPEVPPWNLLYLRSLHGRPGTDLQGEDTGAHLVSFRG